jgi:hypothetical protein
MTNDNFADRYFAWLDRCQAEPAPKALQDEFGLGLQHTGGGCTCLEGRLSPAKYVAITDGDMAHPSKLEDPCFVACARTKAQLDDPDACGDGGVETREFPSVTAACAWLRELKTEE